MLVHLGVIPGVEIGVAQPHQLGGPEHDIAQIVDRVPALGVHSPDGNRLVGTGSSEELFAAVGDHGDVIADLQPEIPEQLDRLFDGQPVGLDVPAIELVEELIQPPEAQAHVGVLEVGRHPADPHRGQPLTKRFGRVFRNPAVDPRDLGQGRLPGRVGFPVAHGFGRCRQVAGIADDPFQHLGDGRIEVFGVLVSGALSTRPDVSDQGPQALVDGPQEIRNGVRNAVGLARQEEHEPLQELHPSPVLIAAAGTGQFGDGVVHPVGEDIEIQDLDLLLTDVVGVAFSAGNGPQFRPQRQAQELRIHQHALEFAGGRAGEGRTVLDGTLLHAAGGPPVGGGVPHDRAAVFQHPLVKAGFVQDGDPVPGEEARFAAAPGDQRRALRADLGRGLEIGVP